VAVLGVAAAGCAEVAWKACRQELGLGLGFSGFLFIAFLCVLLFGVASFLDWIDCEAGVSLIIEAGECGMGLCLVGMWQGAVSRRQHDV